jgi:hypothetical protein
MHQLTNLFAVGTLATRIRPQIPVIVMLPVFAAQILQVRPRQLQTAVALVSDDMLRMAHASAVNHSSEPIDSISLSYNIFKLHTSSH